MTTSWAHLVRADFRESIQANAGGFLLGVVSLLAVPWLIASAIIGRWCYLRSPGSLLFPLFAVVALVTILDWMRHTGLSLVAEQFGRSGW